MKNPLSLFFLVRTIARVQKGNKFLITKRALNDNYRPGERFLPGGKLERSLDDFSLQKNIKKELIEEVGIKVFDEMVLLNNYNFQAKKIYALNITFLCQWKSGNAKALEDTDEIKRQTLDELKINKELSKELKEELFFLEKKLSYIK